MQSRRNALPLFLPFEMEPGEAVRVATQQPHPFAVPADFSGDLKEAIVFISQPTSQVEAFRCLRLQEFEEAAVQRRALSAR